MCVDYRKLNLVTVADPAPMTTAEDLFGKLGKCQYYSTIDLSKGYWQISVAEKDIHKTAFVTRMAVMSSCIWRLERITLEQRWFVA